MTEAYSIGPAPALEPANTLVDSFVKPRESPEAGKQAQELANTLSAVRPELNAFLAPLQDQYEQAESAQGQRFALKNLSISAGDFASQTAGWSIPRVLAASQSLAQNSASNYELELNTALTNAAKTGKPLSPEDINGVIQPLRDKYMQDGQGYGPLWNKTFAEYAQHYELGAMHNYQSQVLDEQGRQAVSNATSDAAIESTALLSLPGDYQTNFKKWLDSYFDPTHLHSPLSPTQKNDVLIGGFKAAVVHALSNGEFGIADELIDGYKNVEVYPGAKLSQTGPGADTLQDLLRQSHYARVNANETDHMQRESDQVGVHMDLLKFKQAQLKLPPDQRQFQVPDDLLTRGIQAGLEPRAMQADLEYFLKTPDREAKQESQSDVQTVKAKSAQAWIDYYGSRNQSSFNTLHKALSDIAQAPEAQGPQAKEVLMERMRVMDEENDKRYADGAQDTSPVVRNAVSTFNRDLYQQMGEFSRTLRGGDTDGLPISRVLKNLPGIDIDPNDPKGERYAAVDIYAHAQDELTSRIHELGGDGWADQQKVNQVRQDVFGKYRDQIQALTKQTQSAVQQASDEQAGEKPVPMVGKDGLPTNKMVSSVLSSRSFLDDAGVDPLHSPLHSMIWPITQAGSQIQKAHVTAGMTADSLDALPLDALRNRLWSPPAGQPVPSFLQEWARTHLMNVFDSSTESLRKFEKDNSKVLSDAATAGGALPNADANPRERSLVIQWAKMRDTWRSLARVRGVTPDELKTIPQSWLTDQNTPYPKVPIFGNEAELNKGVAEVAKDYGLTAAQKQQFIAKQLWLIQQRDRDVQSVAFGTHVSGKAGEPLQYPTQPAPHENFNRVVGQTVEGKPVPSGTPSAAQGFDIEDGKLPKRGD